MQLKYVLYYHYAINACIFSSGKGGMRLVCYSFVNEFYLLFGIYWLEIYKKKY